VVPWFRGSVVPWFHGSMVPWFHGSMVPWFHGSSGSVVPMFNGSMVLSLMYNFILQSVLVRKINSIFCTEEVRGLNPCQSFHYFVVRVHTCVHSMSRYNGVPSSAI